MQTTRTALLLTLAILALPAASADYGAGTGVDKADADHFPAPSFIATALCFVDDDGDGAVDVDEPLYLVYKNAACTTVAGKDVRLVASEAGKGASKVGGSSDADFNAPLAPVPAHAVRFVDRDGDGKLKKGDTAYIDLTNLAGATVSVGDVRLLAFDDLPAFTFVAAGDADLNDALGELKGAVGDQVGADAVADAQVGEAGVVFEAGKGIYLNADGSAADAAIEEGDVRILKVPTPFADLAVGAPAVEVVETTTSEVAGMRLLTVRVRNVDDVTGAALLETSVDGVVVDARGTPTLAPGGEATLVIALPLPAPPVEVQVAQASAPATPPAPAEPPEFEYTAMGARESPGVGTVVLGLALVGMALVLRRRS